MVQYQANQPVRELARGVHPRLLYTAAEIDALRDRLTSDAQAQSQLEDIRRAADQLLLSELKSEEYANAAKTQHGNFYEIGAQLTDLAEKFSLLYSLGETKYVAKMKQALLHYASFAAWTGPSNALRKTPWQSDLSTTRIVYAFAVAYDAMYDAFTPDERCVIREAMLKLGIRPLLADWLTDGVRVHALDSMGHNWWSVCTALAGVALLSIYEEVPDWRELMAGMVASLRAFCDYEGEPLLNKVANFDEKGMFYESCGYFNYGAGELCRFLFHYRRCFDDPADDFPVLPKLGAAFLSLSYPTAAPERTLYVNFGDSALRSNPNGRDGMMMLPQYLLLLGQGDEALRQYYARGARKPNLNDLLYPSLLPRLDATLPPPEQPASEVYDGTGLAFLRSGATEDGNLLAVRCGFTWNHAHDDAGTFILIQNGEDIVCDSGTVSYGKSDYISHYCAAPAHNVVTVNGRGQQRESLYRGNKFPGRLLHLTEGDGISYLLADATGPMCDSCLRNHRSFLRLGEDVFVTVDDLYTYDEAKFSYLLHHRGQSELPKDGSVIIRGDKTALRVASVSPAATVCRAESYEGLSHIAFETVEPSRLCQMMHVISPLEKDVKVTSLSAENGYGIRVSIGEAEYDIYYNFLADGRCMHINSNTVLGGFATDAYILCIVREGGAEKQALMAYGSYLRRGGESVFESLKKEFLIVRL
ncbi:MAG: heparinase II/III-family protein [Clostridia bacterium]|nr:heparinase II/III-family protein [Clostridia bacterium]